MRLQRWCSSPGQNCFLKKLWVYFCYLFISLRVNAGGENHVTVNIYGVFMFWKTNKGASESLRRFTDDDDDASLRCVVTCKQVHALYTALRQSRITDRPSNRALQLASCCFTLLQHVHTHTEFALAHMALAACLPRSLSSTLLHIQSWCSGYSNPVLFRFLRTCVYFSLAV